jgi:hypothetical protein
MNKFLRISLALSTVLFVFSACSNRSSLVKRHYSKGYYFAKTPAVAKPQTQKSEPSKAIAIKSNPAVIDKSGVNSAPKTLIAIPTQSTGTPLVITNPTKKFKVFSKLDSESETKHRHTFFSESKRPFAFASANKEDTSLQNEGRSLFWIVVVVLIVLWALGLISGSFGLGVIFNLLLVIALVLLLLWLLRIV